jgi:hypothetical protein
VSSPPVITLFTAPAPSAHWLAFFRANATLPDRIPWADRPTLAPAQRAAVVASILEFQLGESSEGRHLQTAADRYALTTGDAAYAAAIRLFIREEQRHAAYLARLLAAEGVALKQRTWADSVFRKLRHLGGLESAICVLLTAEIIAQVYYAALRRATCSPVLRAVCRRVLADEAAHVRFQAERLAILRRRAAGRLGLCLALQRLLFAAALAVVWINHGRVLRRGQLGPAGFWRAGWRAFERAEKRMDPRRYSWEGDLGAAA